MARKQASLGATVALSALILAVHPRSAAAQVGQWTSGSPEGWFSSLSVDPSDPWRLYSVAPGDAIWTSDDAGASWSRMDLPFDGTLGVAVSQSRLSALYAFDRDEGTAGFRIFSSRDRGLNWNQTGLRSRDFPNSLAVDPANASTVYALTDQGLYKSSDRGTSWENLKVRGEMSRRVFQILFPPRDSSTVYVVDADYSYYPEYTVDKSTDGGRTWTKIADGVERLVIDPFDSSHLYGTGCQAVFRSTDAGANWSQVPSPALTGCISSLAADPVRRDHLYAGLYAGGVKRSRDGGNTWEPLGTGILGGVLGLAIDPAGLFLHASTSHGVFDIQLAETRPSVCQPGPERLCLLGGRFEVSAKYGDSAARAVAQGDRFGSFGQPETDPAERDIFVKMADQRSGPNREFWFFHSSVTDLSYTITVVDTATGRIRFYRNEPGNPGCGAADTSAFVERPSTTVSEASLPGSDLAPGDGETLSLFGGRFEARLTVVNPFTGASEPGLAMPQTERLGYFSFPSLTGDPAFPEVFVSIAEPRAFVRTISHTGLTNLQYTLTVIDRGSDFARTYQNRRDDVFNLCGGSDTGGFE